MPSIQFYDEIAYLLESAGVGTRMVDIFASSAKALPKGDGPFLSIIETGGTAPDNTQNHTDRPAYQRPGTQIVVRAGTYSAAKTMAVLAYYALFITNQNVGAGDLTADGVWYRSIRPLQEPYDLKKLDPQGRVRVVFNILADKRPSVATGVGPVAQYLIEDFGGDPNAFVAPASSDAYPAGDTFDRIVPGSTPSTFDALPSGTIIFEACAKIVSAPARVKVALFNLETDVMVPNSELTFDVGQTLGQRVRSAALSLSVNTLYAPKMTVDSTAIGGAAYKCRLIHL